MHPWQRILVACALGYYLGNRSADNVGIGSEAEEAADDEDHHGFVADKRRPVPEAAHVSSTNQLIYHLDGQEAYPYEAKRFGLSGPRTLRALGPPPGKANRITVFGRRTQGGMRIIAVFVAVVGVVNADVEHVHVLFRHGDRAPSFTYPLDKQLSATDFPRGFSQLTHQGFEQARELGEYLRYRYTQQYPLLGVAYNRQQVYVRSSDKDRCIETAVGVVQTLFPGQIVPVHTYSSHKDDLLLKPNSLKCAKADRLVARDRLRMAKEMNDEYSELFQLLSEKTGWRVNASNIEDVYNVIYRKFANNIRQPDWVLADYDGENRTVLDAVTELKRQSRLVAFNTDDKAKLRTGHLLAKIDNDVRDVVDGTSSSRLVLYSSHDATVTSLLYSLGVSNGLLPPYASAVMVELHRIQGARFVKVLYRNSSVGEPHELHVPVCDSALCPLATFQRFVADRVLPTRDDFETACENRHRPRRSTRAVENDVQPVDEDVLDVQPAIKWGYNDVYHFAHRFVLPPVLVTQATALIYFYLTTISQEFSH